MQELLYRLDDFKETEKTVDYNKEENIIQSFDNLDKEQQLRVFEVLARRVRYCNLGSEEKFIKLLKDKNFVQQNSL